VLGLAYKPDVDDDRESPSYLLLDLLKKRGADTAYYDPHVPVIRPSREHGHWAGTRSVAWTPEVIGQFEVVLISTNHKGWITGSSPNGPAVSWTPATPWPHRNRPGLVWKA